MGKFEMVSAALVLDTSSPTMLRWAYTSKRQGNCQAVAGKPAGSMTGKYPSVSIGKRRVLVHQAVWMLKHKCPIPEGLVIDPIDGNKYNPHPDSLQAITPQANVRKGQLCVSAVGFSWYARRNVWRVRIRKPGRSSQIDIGSFKCMLDARAAYLRACLEVYHS
ncbi:HNH endonuclease [Escherichia phage vB_EcoP_ZX6]|uniref:HNH endonuclease n=1 Tax=Escherichia phage vB_EcoP_ZX6 TaxID=2851033 RepID=A0AAE7VG85_9CAUD|nr:HNH endonuclease [Escherichia phage vB_EcoP_ZX6]